MEKRTEIIRQICCSPCCRESLSWGEQTCACSHCRKTFPYRNGKICFTSFDSSELTLEAKINISLLEGKTFLSRLIKKVKRTISSEYEPHHHLGNILENLKDDMVIIECGAGNRRLNADVVNIDQYPFDETDLISDITFLPVKSGTVDLVILDTVLEHVKEPQRCIDESFRVLKSGGEIVCITPFIFPYHAYPRHYWNFSEDGLRYLFRGFTSCQVETNMGPTSALINLVSEYIALVFSGKGNLLYPVFKGLTLIPLFILKYLDHFWYDAEKSKRIAMCLFTHAKK
jgi:SAM-dependent methyltransferase